MENILIVDYPRPIWHQKTENSSLLEKYKRWCKKQHFKSRLILIKFKINATKI